MTNQPAAPADGPAQHHAQALIAVVAAGAANGRVRVRVHTYATSGGTLDYGADYPVPSVLAAIDEADTLTWAPEGLVVTRGTERITVWALRPLATSVGDADLARVAAGLSSAPAGATPGSGG